MRLRTFTVSLIAAVAATLPLAGVALAQDQNCADFSSQEEAQDALQPGDPDNLDEDGDGSACETYDYSTATTPSTSDTTTPTTSATTSPTPTSSTTATPTTSATTTPTTGAAAPPTTTPTTTHDKKADGGQVAVIPRGGVATGDGTSDDGPAEPLLIGGVIALGTLAAATWRRARSSR